MNSLAQAAGHADRNIPITNYCKGLLLPGERKSVEPMAAKLAPAHTERMHPSLHPVVAEAPWSEEALLGEVRHPVIPIRQKQGTVVAWMVEDTGFPKKGQHSVGVARQYCGQWGKQDHCQGAVSLSLATEISRLPMAYRLYWPEVWAEDAEGRDPSRVAEAVRFQTKPQIALDPIRPAVQADVPRGVVLADAAYGKDTHFRSGVTELGLQYAVGVQSSMTVWKPGREPLPAKEWTGTGRPPKLLRRNGQHKPVTVQEVALELPNGSWKDVTGREGSERNLRSRLAAVRVRPAHRDNEKAEPYPEQWLWMEWPRGEPEPTPYWLSTLPAETKLKEWVKIAKHRWILERDYEEWKPELGWGHYEGRGGRGFHHPGTLCIAA
jgi:SRSO17 transposase